jgi:excinuclease ABC subunit B
MINQAIFVSATPADYELEQSGGAFVEQIIRPTGLMEPEVEVRPVENQIDDMIDEIRKRVECNERTLVITLTKRLSEEVSEYLKNIGIKAAYMHSELDALERVEVLYKFRRGDFDVLVGINLLREGIDIPELSLVAILDADKEGFLRSETSLFQIVGRAARNVNGKAIMYADKVTDSMQTVMDEMDRRRAIQAEYNEKHGINPETSQKELKPLVDPMLISSSSLDLEDDQREEPMELVRAAEEGIKYKAGPDMKEVTFEDKDAFLEYLQESMYSAAKNMEFEEAARIRDQIEQIKNDL